ncbi:hypothetical protein TWF102_007967 [Orbilia oligospora]|uniref:Uncharacterized protein n=1 Tax=Orbilia oligospora TaxID=2813651 RepID=A0A7C8N9Q3_ORBOL|nr:hypothetical protein TWF102_007967 [Orbilia oligospora]KAF3108433.1 hypothetical protein TWF103_005516 [Orbilia oligospora]
MYHHASSSIHLLLLLLTLKFIGSAYCSPEQSAFIPTNPKDTRPEIPDVDYETDTFGDRMRADREKWIDRKIFAILDKPELFNTEDMIPFGIDGEKKGLFVAWNVDPTSKAYSVSALTNARKWVRWFVKEYKIPQKKAFPAFIHWRFLPITKLHPNTLDTSFRTDYPREQQYFVVNEHLAWSQDPVVINGMRLLTSTKYGMGASEFGDGDITLDLGAKPGKWVLFDEAENEEARNGKGGGVLLTSLVDSTYQGLSNTNLTILTRFPPEDHVIVNVCGALEYKEGIDFSKSDIGVFHIMLSKEKPMQERTIIMDESLPIIEVCSTATLMTKIWPF